MTRISRLLMIGSVCRNSGKTELACMVIREFHKKHKIIALKVSTHYTDDIHFHKNPFDGNYSIIKDTDKSTDKNTARMLKAGASEVYWLRTKIEYIDVAIKEFLSNIGKNCFIVCESNSLRKVVHPGVFIMIDNNSEIKSSAIEVMGKADIIINSNGKDFFNFDISNIAIENDKWILKNKNQ